MTNISRALSPGGPDSRNFPRAWLAPAALLAGLAALSEAAGRFGWVSPFVLPAPTRIAATLVARLDVLAPEALTTLVEILGGFAFGVAAGVAAALAMALSPRLARALGPLMVALQALPVFAIAPVLVVWLGFGLAPKLVMAALIIFFPVASAFFEGLRRVDPALIDLARLNQAGRLATLRLIRVPAALPHLAAGVRVAAAVAPLGAIVGEWVGASHGLGLLMLHANARMQTDLVFAALVLLTLMALAFWLVVGWLSRRWLTWSIDTLV